jgi:hypothetical protein
MTRRNVLISAGIIIVAIVATAILLPNLTGKSTKPAVTPQPSATTSTSVSSSPAAGASPSASTSWSTAEVSLDSVLKSGAAQVITIRTGAHPEAGYDRISIDFQGQAPGVRARYVNQVVQDGSGALVTLPGAAYLQLTFSPAVAHDDSGTSNVPKGVQTTGFAGLKSYVVNGDFEGVVSVALGQSAKAGFKINRQDRGGVSTIYVDLPRP